jgi:hypothetical protein
MFAYLLRPILWFVGWWSGLDPWLRLGVPLVLLGVSAVLLIFHRFFVVGWALGVVLLLCSGRSEAEKKGYHF